ncbi:PREDICTED: ribosomal protein 63, mitochondrial [Ceratosolen solmsi marchali]|uniref:Ribosomal protein 63, mitochondrial n=1 Tax=Ceratosolen solmsi marchali TaxID=326594 RepID=A0AAJ6YGB9_9HYME|nr:PREDICTED: ribosomal protein 63, mitochondrial [Ceratosolen solmsi marchali]
MRLSALLYFGKKPHGIKYRGKYRVVREIKTSELRQLKAEYERTEKNMLYLRHPYLTIEQSFNHMSREDRNKSFWEKVRKPRDERFSNHVTLAERLINLKVKDAWE